MSRITVHTLREKASRGAKITMLTAYDFSMARLLDEGGIDILLVGDSLGMVVLGYENTLPVTVDEMIHHTRAVARGASRSMVIGDMPFMSYQGSEDAALMNAGRFLKEGMAHGVKLEGGREYSGLIRRMVSAGIPVMGHLGLTPQSVNVLGGYKVQGKTVKAARRLIEDARTLEEAGIFSLVLECVPAELAGLVADTLEVPVIGIGAGPLCDGQVLVVNDMLGLFSDFSPKHNRRFTNLRPLVMEALEAFKADVESGAFPGEEHGSKLPPDVLDSLKSS
jgi:3-methyl-2-oxobutanoate hydroxymethyltransferase